VKVKLLYSITLLFSTFLGLIDQLSNFNPAVSQWFQLCARIKHMIHNFEKFKKCFIGVFKE